MDRFTYTPSSSGCTAFQRVYSACVLDPRLAPPLYSDIACTARVRTVFPRTAKTGMYRHAFSHDRRAALCGPCEQVVPSWRRV